MPNIDAILSVRDVSYVYSPKTPYEKTALDHVSLDIERGVITGIIGHTGSGKSTLVQLFNGLEKPHSGSILLDGRDIWVKPKEIRAVRFRVGLVMQYPEYQLFEETVRADIAYGPKNMGLEQEEIKQRVGDAIRFVEIDESLLDASPFDLSGGQKRRVAIAGIIAMRPDVLVLDEPAAGLDPRGREAIFRGIRNYQKETGASVVIVSHSMEDMARICDRLIVMSDARVVMSGTPDEIFSRGDELHAIGLNVPEVTRTLIELRKLGISVNTDVYAVDAAVKEIGKLL
ncbi:MAG: energy-coupling factor transporter ATPase [Clostridia bacterium]|nr:energy-coupling factor transporter ATPase [Clostridia bacterium]